MQGTSTSGQPLLTPVLVRMLEGRVGSTLMMELLGSSAAVAFERVYPYEHSYLTYFVRLLKQAASHTGAPWTMDDLRHSDLITAGPFPFRPRSLHVKEFSAQSLMAMWRIASQSFRDAAPDPLTHYAEKFWGTVSPVIEAHLSPIVIDLVRDPRDIVVSIRAFNAQRSVEMFGRSSASDDVAHLHQVVVGMGFRLREMDEPLPVSRRLLRYEDLVTDVAGSASSLSSFLEVDLDPRAALSRRAEVARHKTSVSAADSVGRWRSELSPTDTEFIERRLGSHMTRLGYPLSSNR